MTRRKTRVKARQGPRASPANTRTFTLHALHTNPVTLKKSTGVGTFEVKQELFPALGRELVNVLQWRIKRAQASYVSICAADNYGAVAMLLCHNDMAGPNSQNTIVSSGGVLGPLYSSRRLRSNTIGAASEWVSSSAMAAFLSFSWTGAGPVAVDNSPLVAGYIEIDVTFEVRGSRI